MIILSSDYIKIMFSFACATQTLVPVVWFSDLVMQNLPTYCTEPYKPVEDVLVLYITLLYIYLKYG